MTPEEQEVADAAEALKKADEEKVAGAEALKKAEEEKEVGYEAELKRLRDERDNARKDAAHKEEELQKVQQKKKELEEQAKNAPSEEQLAEKLGLKTLNEKIENLEKKLGASSVDVVIAGMSGDASERELIKHHFENTIKQTGNLAEDLRRAHLLANEKFIFGGDKTDEILARISGASPAGSREEASTPADPSMERVLDQINPKAKERFRQYMRQGTTFVKSK